MKIYTEIIGNLQDPEWVKKAREAEIEYIDLDQWTAQKSRFVVKGDRENEYAVALKRHSQMLDGDIIEYLPEQRRIAAIRIRLNDVLVADLSDLARQTPETIISRWNSVMPSATSIGPQWSRGQRSTFR